MTNPTKRTVNARLGWMDDLPDSSPNNQRVIDPWDPSTDVELEAAANALLFADKTDGPQILTVDKLRVRREREVYSPENRIEPGKGLYIRSTASRDMSADAEKEISNE